MLDTTYFPGAKKYWHMGKIYDWESRIVHVMSHVLHYGSSVFEGIRAYETDEGPAIFRLGEHIDRLFVSASAIFMDVPYSREEIMEACRLIVRENRLRSAYIRPNLFFAYGNLGLTPKASPVELTIGCWEWGAYLGNDSATKGVRVLLLPWKRIHPSQMNSSVKLGGLYVQSNIFATQARKLGFDEAVFLNLEERISEGPGENVLIVKDGVLRTNDRSESILEGITRTSILEIAGKLGIATAVGPITVDDLLNADEAFFSGTAAEVTPITRITDGRDGELPKEKWTEHHIGDGKPGAITLQLAQFYAETVRGRREEFHHWLTPVYDSPRQAQRQLNGQATKTKSKRLAKY